MGNDTQTTLSNFDPFNRPVEGFVENGEYAISDTVLILAGPPRIDNVTGLDLAQAQGTAELSVPGTDNVFYPIGTTQRFIKSEGKQSIPILEIGSERVQLIPTKTTGAFTMDKVLLDNPSLLRAMTAIYKSSGQVNFNALIDTYDSAQTDLELSGDPGRNNWFLTLFSDLFNYPVGMLLAIANQRREYMAGLYFEDALINAHTMSIDAQTNLLIESTRVTYSRSIPAKFASA